MCTASCDWHCSGDRIHFFFFFNDTATTEIYTLSLHDTLPIYSKLPCLQHFELTVVMRPSLWRSEEHTSELQSPCNLVCRLLLEKKKDHTAELRSDWQILCSLALASNHALQ